MINFEDGKAYEKPRVYLAGGMEHAEGWGQEWREEFTPWLEALGYEVFNPLEAQEEVTGLTMEELRELKSNSVRQYMNVMSDIVTEDLKQLSQCEAVVCLLDESVKKGAGTYGELTYCKSNDIPVYACIDLTNGAEDLPGWCLGCITDFEESTEMFQHMMRAYDAAHIMAWKKRKKIEEISKFLT